MSDLNPLLLVGAVIGVITALLVAAYGGVKDKKTAMGFERNMDDGEILRRLAGYARPYLGKFILVGFLMLFPSPMTSSRPSSSAPLRSW